MLEPSTTQLVRDDFEAFFRREQWFREHGLPFRRGYLFYGPPGNGKTTVIKVMASHPAITPFILDLGNEFLNNDALTSFFETAAQHVPSLLIFEDLDRSFSERDHHDCSSKVTLQHFLNCLDGIGTQNGLLVVATANDPAVLDGAILKRPGRFDRVIGFHPPNRELCARYLSRLSGGKLCTDELRAAALETDGFSFAQLRESYILAGGLAFEHCLDVSLEHLRAGVKMVRRELTEVKSSGTLTKTGFDAHRSGD